MIIILKWHGAYNFLSFIIQLFCKEFNISCDSSSTGETYTPVLLKWMRTHQEANKNIQFCFFVHQISLIIQITWTAMELFEKHSFTFKSKLIYIDKNRSITTTAVKWKLHASGAGKIYPVQTKNMTEDQRAGLYPSKHMTFMQCRTNVNAMSWSCSDTNVTLP